MVKSSHYWIKYTATVPETWSPVPYAQDHCPQDRMDIPKFGGQAIEGKPKMALVEVAKPSQERIRTNEA